MNKTIYYPHELDKVDKKDFDHFLKEAVCTLSPEFNRYAPALAVKLGECPMKHQQKGHRKVRVVVLNSLVCAIVTHIGEH